MRIRVTGGQPLNGTYRPSGNPNAAVALIAASLLTDQPVTLNTIPNTGGTRIMLSLCEALGATVTRDENAHTATIHAAKLGKRELTREETNGTVASLLLLVPVLVRRQYVKIELDFPLNRIRTHIEALRNLGQDVVVGSNSIECRPMKWAFKDIVLSQTSVTATAITLMLAATLGEETLIQNAASEPHIQELANLLERMGAQIHGIGSNVLRIFGAASLNGTTFDIGPNHIETASIAAISALCDGRVTIEGTRQNNLRVIDMIYRRLGITLDIDENSVFIPRHTDLIVSNREEDVDSSIETAPWPGFPSDLVAVATVAATQARGTSLIHEKLFNNRLLFIDKLNAMGAQIVLCDPHRAIVIGPAPLHAIYMDSPDVRAGMGMLAAALIADGETVMDNAHVIDNAFEGVLHKLQALGAQIVIE